jgi:ribonucleoside-triphosphate reductase (thioredoxin)
VVTYDLRTPETIRKRDGRVVQFDAERIEGALTRCFKALGVDPQTPISQLTRRVVNTVSVRGVPTVEGVQDIVEMVLQAAGEFAAAKAYILYRAGHAKSRKEEGEIPDGVRTAFESDEKYFPTPLQRFQFVDKYARWNTDAGRRETWMETVDRTVDQLYTLAFEYADLDTSTYEEIRKGILEMRAMPSMRLLSMAGPAFERDNATQYNCTYLPIDSIESWCEAMWLSMAGCGVGFSVEGDYVDQLPRVRRQKGGPAQAFVVEDSSEGWCESLRVGSEAWLSGEDVVFDFSHLRPRGAVLRTKGGRASGPDPLKKLLDFTRTRILARQGRTLRSIDAHDIVCAVGGAAVSGGVRRTAMISIFDYEDLDMLTSKSGDFESMNNQRWNANNSIIWDNIDLMTQEQFISQFMEMVRSGRGEPGIFNRDAARRLIPNRRDWAWRFGSNPCGEIVLRPHGMCNLTTVVARTHDTLVTLRGKVRLASIIGTIQSLGTHFPYLRSQWRQNCEEERLLGVSIGGQLDCPLLVGPQGDYVMRLLRTEAIRTNIEVAHTLGINSSAAVTCVKPDGNSSQLVDMSSGLHARWAPYYIRNVRVSGTSALARVLRDSGAPMAPENGDDQENPHTWVVSFPVKAPDGAVTRGGRSAITQCEYWLRNKRKWTEHNPSVTITYRPDEVLDLMQWVWEHRREVGGMAFLPDFDAKYDQLPYIEITESEYERRVAEFPEIDWARIWRYESDDQTTAAQEVACSAGTCEVGS